MQTVTLALLLLPQWDVDNPSTIAACGIGGHADDYHDVRLIAA